jgi:hypothetical protein
VSEHRGNGAEAELDPSGGIRLKIYARHVDEFVILTRDQADELGLKLLRLVSQRQRCAAGQP